MQKKRMNSSLITSAIALCLLAISVLGAKTFFSRYVARPSDVAAEYNRRFDFPALASAVAVSPDSYKKMVSGADHLEDLTMMLFRSDVSRKDVIFFFTQITGSEALATIILENAVKNNIPASLAFSLAWEESRYQPRAVNKNAASIDRGLFQLNSSAFPDLTEKEFFNPDISAYYGLAHLNVCMEQAGNEIAALAMYNAGSTKVRNNKTPQRTLDYISRITSYRDRLENLFRSEIALRYRIDEDGNVISVLGSLVAEK